MKSTTPDRVQHFVIIEVDGYETHGTQQAFEHDRRRDQRLKLAGWNVIRFTWRQITKQPKYVAATLRRLLARAQAA